MKEEPWFVKRNREAGERLAALVALPLPQEQWEIGDDQHFHPWRLFPSLYGTYAGDFDLCAVEVLEDLRDGTHRRSDLAAYMLKEMLCTADLCEYGTSPRVCFPNEPLRAALPELIEKWKVWYAVHWGEPFPE